MKPQLITGVPLQEKGSFHDTESIRVAKDFEDIVDLYKTLKDRLLSVNYWNYYASGVGADFKLHDKNGNLKKRLPEKGDFIRIDIPGPGNFEARGFDWVEITDMYENLSANDEILEQLLIECKPSGIPGKINTHTAHFYTGDASSTFIVSRGKDFIKAGIYGRNETPNMDAQIADKARNLAIALGGMVGISKIQWKILTDGLVEFRSWWYIDFEII
ncbi:hypothetical protein [Chryseobacterium vrystaatense]|uniref:Uncharacterized protein n=2 Tax=Chryseobacterium TaxID=59732 RepID=A0A1M5H0G9_9FLAO|nr:hypothetical protein [Chryseobacterium vrystaatense]SHG09427.1 hypothetical protein SAMN02787073_3532 [Chryseobacterium vrystaatense]